MKVFIDTGGFLAIADKSDSYHGVVTSIYQGIINSITILKTFNPNEAFYILIFLMHELMIVDTYVLIALEKIDPLHK